MKKQKNIFQLELENQRLKENLIYLELNKLIPLNFKDKFLSFIDNFSYLEKLVDLIIEYEHDAYLIYIHFINKSEENININEFINDLNTIISNTIKPFSPVFFYQKGIILYSFANSISEIKAKSNLFLYNFNQSILSTILESNIFIFSVMNCSINTSKNETLKEHFFNKFKNLISEIKNDENLRIVLVNLKEIYEAPEIFLVEPDAFNAAIVINILKQNNINCAWFRDGKLTYERLKSSHPICIISELVVPGLGAFDLRQKLLEDGLNIPLIILSAQKNDDLIKTASLLGINYFLKKPYFINELISTIRVFISSSI